jgi:hypothetical protein
MMGEEGFKAEEGKRIIGELFGKELQITRKG